MSIGLGGDTDATAGRLLPGRSAWMARWLPLILLLALAAPAAAIPRTQVPARTPDDLAAALPGPA